MIDARSNAHPFFTAGLSALLLLVSACAPPDSTPDERAASELDDADRDEGANEESIDYGKVAETPYIHLRQTVVMVGDGEPVRESLFRMVSEGCRKLVGTVPVKPLREEDVDMIGRTYYEAWYQGLRMAVRADTWDYVDDERSPCTPTLSHESTLRIVTPEGRWDIDLGKGTGEFYAGPQNVRAPLSRRHDEYESAEARDDALTHDARAVRAMGASDVLIPKPTGTLRIAGRSCNALRHEFSEDNAIITCQWNEGRDWGFGFGEADPADLGLDAYDSGIQLSRRFEGVSGFGPTLTTDEMTVGVPFDDSVFEVPSGIKLEVVDYDSDGYADDADDDDDIDRSADDEDSYDDDADEEDEDSDVSLDDLRKLASMDFSRVVECNEIAVSMAPFTVIYPYVSEWSRLEEAPPLSLDNASAMAEGMEGLAEVLHSQTPREVLLTLAREVRAQAGRKPMEFTPAMQQSIAGMTAWLKANCTEEALLGASSAHGGGG